VEHRLKGEVGRMKDKKSFRVEEIANQDKRGGYKEFILHPSSFILEIKGD
jgi:hypothetical protein